jgi:hypothetical protein
LTQVWTADINDNNGDKGRYTGCNWDIYLIIIIKNNFFFLSLD